MPDTEPDTELGDAVGIRPATTPAGPADVDQYSVARAARKAQTRSEISRVAHQLFTEHGFDAVTVADVAAAASVSAQTVYNHFATKEDLFFEGRTRWVEGPADAVRSRTPGTPPLTALRDYLIESVWDSVYLDAGPDGHLYTAAVESSPTLRVHERTLFDRAERQLTQALADAGASDHKHDTAACSQPPGQVPKAALISATWLAAARVVVASHRSPGEDPARMASEAASLLDQILCRLGDRLTIFGRS